MATISIEPKIFTLINTFTVEADKADAVVASLRDGDGNANAAGLHRRKHSREHGR